MRKQLKYSDLASETEKRFNNLEQVHADLLKQLANSSEGKIHIVNSCGRVQYYLRRKSAERSGTYLKKKRTDMIKVYLQKSYNEKVIKEIEQEQLVLGQFMESYRDLPMRIKEIYGSFPEEARKLIEPVDLPNEEFEKRWSSLPYKSKETEAFQTPFVTERGEYVRSKSELNIANALHNFKIPYRYECRLELRRGLFIHPDFTVLNVNTRTVYYWEHRGMMDDREYARHAVQRVKDYGQAGIFPGQRLILTEETASIPLGSREIKDIIRTYLKA